MELEELRFSQVLEGLAETDRPSVSLGEATRAVGTRAHGVAMLLLVLPELMPLPVSVSLVVGIPLFLISIHLAAFGEIAGLPSRMRALPIPTGTFRLAARYLTPTLLRLETISRPRLPGLAQADTAIGIACSLLAVILLLPVPFLNFAPAVILSLIAWGMIQRDGLLIGIGLAGTALLTLLLPALSSWLYGAAVGFLRGFSL